MCFIAFRVFSTHTSCSLPICCQPVSSAWCQYPSINISHFTHSSTSVCLIVSLWSKNMVTIEQSEKGTGCDVFYGILSNHERRKSYQKVLRNHKRNVLSCIKNPQKCEAILKFCHECLSNKISNFNFINWTKFSVNSKNKISCALKLNDLSYLKIIKVHKNPFHKNLSSFIPHSILTTSSRAHNNQFSLNHKSRRVSG